MSNSNQILANFSKHLFWDVDINNVDMQKHAKFIIKKVLQYGTIDDWRLILQFYGKNIIIKHATTIKDLDKKTLSFLSVIGEIDKTKFACYTTIQSSQKHWNF